MTDKQSFLFTDADIEYNVIKELEGYLDRMYNAGCDTVTFMKGSLSTTINEDNDNTIMYTYTVDELEAYIKELKNK